MKIAKIAVYKLASSLRKPFQFSGGRSMDTFDDTIVAITTDEGIIGWGESCPYGSSYLPAYPRGVRTGIEELAPSLLNENPLHIDKINHLMDTTLLGHPYVKSAIDMACWDILGKYANLSVCELLGGRFGEAMDLMVAIDAIPPQEAVDKIAKYRQMGYRKFSCKCSGDPKIDTARMHAIMSSAIEAEDYIFDANKGYTCANALRVMRSARDLDVTFEQPCATYEECLSVQRRTLHPIMLDEIFENMDTLIRLLSDRSAEAINIKTAKVGGVTKARRIRDVAITSGTMMAFQDTGGSQIAAAAILHLAQSTPQNLVHSIWIPGRDDTIAEVVVADGIGEVINGRLSAPAGPGLGVKPRLEVLGEPVAVYH